MRRLICTAAAMAALVASGAFLHGAEAAALAPYGARPALDAIAVIETAQFVFEGREHCFYPDGWHGPGWYWCGYRWRRGLGWGGAEGWHGWDRHAHGGERHERREIRRERHEERRGRHEERERR